eukprot:1588128-Alexandrium_andersonii.AAC.1
MPGASPGCHCTCPPMLISRRNNWRAKSCDTLRGTLSKCRWRSLCVSRGCVRGAAAPSCVAALCWA